MKTKKTRDLEQQLDDLQQKITDLVQAHEIEIGARDDEIKMLSQQYEMATEARGVAEEALKAKPRVEIQKEVVVVEADCNDGEPRETGYVTAKVRLYYNPFARWRWMTGEGDADRFKGKVLGWINERD